MDYSPAALAAAAGVDPWALHGKLTSGKPDVIRGVGLQFRDSGPTIDINKVEGMEGVRRYAVGENAE